MAEKKTKRPKSPREKLRAKLTKLSKRVVRQRDGHICQRCRRHVVGLNRHCSHVFPVSSGSILEWDPLNMKILCFHCHINWWHKNPLKASEWFKEKFPERFEYLENKMLENAGHKFSLMELEQMAEDLTKQLKGEL